MLINIKSKGPKKSISVVTYIHETTGLCLNNEVTVHCCIQVSNLQRH